MTGKRKERNQYFNRTSEDPESDEGDGRRQKRQQLDVDSDATMIDVSDLQDLCKDEPVKAKRRLVKARAK